MPVKKKKAAPKKKSGYLTDKQKKEAAELKKQKLKAELEKAKAQQYYYEKAKKAAEEKIRKEMKEKDEKAYEKEIKKKIEEEYKLYHPTVKAKPAAKKPKYSAINAEVGSLGLDNVRSDDLNKCSYIMKEVLDAYRKLRAKDVEIKNAEKVLKEKQENVGKPAPPYQPAPQVEKDKWVYSIDVPKEYQNTDTLPLFYLYKFGVIQLEDDVKIGRKHISKFVPHGTAGTHHIFPKVEEMVQSYNFAIYPNRPEVPSDKITVAVFKDGVASELAKAYGFVDSPNFNCVFAEITPEEMTLVVRSGVFKGILVRRALYLSFSPIGEPLPGPLPLNQNYGGIKKVKFL